MKYIAAIDQGTTSTRCVLLDRRGIVASAQREHRQIMPQPGWVEHDAAEIWQTTAEVIREAIAGANARPGDVGGLGITNQRETVVAWNRRTSEPLANAIVWQDTRTADLCARLAAEGGADRFRAATGLPVSTYFSATKIRWMLDNVPAVKRAADDGSLAVGTIDAWLVYNLAGGAWADRGAITDVTNASRTQLMNLRTLDWDEDLLKVFGIPRQLLPMIVPSNLPGGYVQTDRAGPFGASVPIAAILGDQQAALVGQGCFAAGECKNTYGTGNFLLMNTGETPVASTQGLLTTVAYEFANAPVQYALEGSVAVTGSLVQWLRDNLGIVSKAAEIEALAASVPDTGDVYIVPAFSGLFAPYWRPDARGTIVGMTRFTAKAHLARAALEAVAFQTRDVLDAMVRDAGRACPQLKVDGGMTANDLLMQIQADVLGVPVMRPTVTETTALGAAYAAGAAVGFYGSPGEMPWTLSRRFEPAMDAQRRDRVYARWKEAVEKSMGWAR